MGLYNIIDCPKKRLFYINYSKAYKVWQRKKYRTF